MLTHCGTAEIRTARLLLRRYRTGDAAILFENWAGDPRVTDRLDRAADESAAKTEGLTALWEEAYASDTVYRWCICLEGEPVGDICVTRWSGSDEWCELGYCIAAKCWNQGYMTEALNAVKRYLFEAVHFHRIALKYDCANPASGRVMRRCGFLEEGILRGYKKRRDGSFADIGCYGLTMEEYEKGEGR